VTIKVPTKTEVPCPGKVPFSIKVPAQNEVPSKIEVPYQGILLRKLGPRYMMGLTKVLAGIIKLRAHEK